MTRHLQWHVYDGLSKFSATIFVLLTLFLWGSLLFAAFHAFSAEDHLLSSVFQSNLFRLIFTGLVFALIASIAAWPFALATAVILVQESMQVWTKPIIRFFRVLVYLPSLIYGFIFCWALGPALQSKLHGTWMSLFSNENWVTEILAFAVTLVGYPLTVFDSSIESLSVDSFYKLVKGGVVSLAADSFSAFIIIISLAFFLIPMFVIALHGILLKKKNDDSILAAKALGATDWESLHLTMIHAMRTNFIGVFLFGVGKAFVEGVSIFIVLNFFFISGNWQESFWGETLSSYLIKTLLSHQLSWHDYSFLVSTLVLTSLVINYFRRSFLAIEGEELTL